MYPTSELVCPSTRHASNLVGFNLRTNYLSRLEKLKIKELVAVVYSGLVVVAFELKYVILFHDKTFIVRKRKKKFSGVGRVEHIYFCKSTAVSKQ